MEIKFLTDKIKHKKTLKKAKVHTNPDIFWRLIFFLMICLTILGCILGLYLFRQINQEFVLLSPDSNTSVGAIKKDNLVDVLEYFSEKQENSNTIITSPSPIVNPSL